MPVNATNINLDMIAPSFKLMNVDNTFVSLSDAKGESGTVIVFISNHCPYVKSIANRLKKEADELLKNNIKTIAIMPNDTESYPEDSFDNMKIFAKKYKFNFPYLYDESQVVAKKYEAICTPDFFGFNKNLELKYRGRIDSGNNYSEDKEISRDLFDAMIMIKNYDTGPSDQVNSIGCSIKWKKYE